MRAQVDMIVVDELHHEPILAGIGAQGNPGRFHPHPVTEELKRKAQRFQFFTEACRPLERDPCE
jgi:hypothetical protein